MRNCWRSQLPRDRGRTRRACSWAPHRSSSLTIVIISWSGPQGAAPECLPSLLAQAPADATVVVFHTAVLAHFTDQARTTFEQQLHELSAQRPFTWIQGEPQPDAQPRLRLAQLANGQIHTAHPLAHYHPHGAWLEWASAGLIEQPIIPG